MLPTIFYVLSAAHCLYYFGFLKGFISLQAILVLIL